MLRVTRGIENLQWRGGWPTTAATLIRHAAVGCRMGNQLLEQDMTAKDRHMVMEIVCEEPAEMDGFNMHFFSRDVMSIPNTDVLRSQLIMACR